MSAAVLCVSNRDRTATTRKRVRNMREAATRASHEGATHSHFCSDMEINSRVLVDASAENSVERIKQRSIRKRF